MTSCDTPYQAVPPEMWQEFCEWVRDAGYDQSYMNRWDSKCLFIQELFLEELRNYE